MVCLPFGDGHPPSFVFGQTRLGSSFKRNDWRVGTVGTGERDSGACRRDRRDRRDRGRGKSQAILRL